MNTKASSDSVLPKKRFQICDLAVPLIVGLVGVAGSLGGVFLASSMNTAQAERLKAVEWENQIITQRVSILDRTAKIFGKAPGVQDVWIKYADHINKTEGLKPDPPLEIVEKLTEYQGEYQSTVYLAATFFGPKTRAAIKELGDENGPWWNKTKSKQDALLGAMVGELAIGANHLPKILQSP